jgi:hypothetical protein
MYRLPEPYHTTREQPNGPGKVGRLSCFVFRNRKSFNRSKEPADFSVTRTEKRIISLSEIEEFDARIGADPSDPIPHQSGELRLGDEAAR